MSVNTYSHLDYIDAFQQFMQSGEKESLTPYLEDSRPDGFLSVYRNGFIRASANALESNFPSVVKFWGVDYFAQVAAAYTKVSPPTIATLIAYGFDDYFDNCFDSSATPSFIHFIQQNLTEVIEQYPYVSDLCRLDQAWSESLNEDGESFLTIDVVQKMISEGTDLAELPLTLVESSRIVELDFDIFELWGQLRFGEIEVEQKIELNEVKNSVLFWQMDLQVQAKPLTATESVFMQGLKQDPNFDAASNLALEIDNSFDVSTLFAELLNAQLLQQLQQKKNESS